MARKTPLPAWRKRELRRKVVALMAERAKHTAISHKETWFALNRQIAKLQRQIDQ